MRKDQGGAAGNVDLVASLNAAQQQRDGAAAEAEDSEEDE